jgi:hypothetical protein
MRRPRSGTVTLTSVPPPRRLRTVNRPPARSALWIDSPFSESRTKRMSCLLTIGGVSNPRGGVVWAQTEQPLRTNKVSMPVLERSAPAKSLGPPLPLTLSRYQNLHIVRSMPQRPAPVRPISLVRVLSDLRQHPDKPMPHSQQERTRPTECAQAAAAKMFFFENEPKRN